MWSRTPISRRDESAIPARNSIGRGWRTPAWKDPAFWVTFGITVVAVAIQAAFIKDRSNLFSWAALALQALVTWVVLSALVRTRIGIQRALAEGVAEAEEKVSRITLGDGGAPTGTQPFDAG